jgi:hypothetical protein
MICSDYRDFNIKSTQSIHPYELANLGILHQQNLTPRSAQCRLNSTQLCTATAHAAINPDHALLRLSLGLDQADFILLQMKSESLENFPLIRILDQSAKRYQSGLIVLQSDYVSLLRGAL